VPLTDIFGRMPLERIWVNRPERQRREVDLEKGGFLASVALRGVLNAVILEEVPDARGYHILYAGERRYAASLHLGLPDIPFRFAREPSAVEIQIIELEENIKRTDLTWQETCQAVVRVHGLFRSENSSHTLEDTGAALGWLDGSHVAQYLFIHDSWHDEAVRACTTKNEAYNLLQRRAKRAQANKLEEWIGRGGGEDEGEGEGGGSGGSPFVVSSPTDGTPGNSSSPPRGEVASAPSALPVVHADFLTWAPSYVGGKFNLIHCDFPYGIGLGEAKHRHGANALVREIGDLYDDGVEVYNTLLECLVRNFDNFASESCHLMFWYSNRVEVEELTRAALGRIPGLNIFTFPLVWVKSDNAGFITPTRPRHIYETCLVGVRGERPHVRHVSDAYSSPSDNSLHVSAKPEPMLRYFMGMLVDEHSRVLDPTCGSGSALRAAEALRAEKVLGLETNPEMVRVANKALLEARVLRKLAGAEAKTSMSA
jgi:hypothetical protein